MKGGENKKPHAFGYTIIEVMLFLAISGFMFVLAAIFINGKQANAEFKQSVNDANTQIRTVMNDVINGFYPSSNNFVCSAAPSGGQPTITATTGPGQGQNLGCMFLGKVVQFGVGSNAGGGWSNYRVYSVAARQYVGGTSGQTPANFAEARPAAINIADSIEDHTYEWGLTATAVCSPAPATGSTCTSTTAGAGAIGFFGAFGSFDSSSNTLQSGSQEVNVALIPGSTLGDTDEVTNITALATGGSILPSPNILLCFQDGKGHKASITIGGTNGQQLATSVTMGDARC